FSPLLIFIHTDLSRQCRSRSPLSVSLFCTSSSGSSARNTQQSRTHYRSPCESCAPSACFISCSGPQFGCCTNLRTCCCKDCCACDPPPVQSWRTAKRNCG